MGYSPKPKLKWTNTNCKSKLDIENSAKGRTNIELREQFILADGVSQSMASFTPKRAASVSAQNGNNNSNTPPYMSSQGPIIKVNKIAFKRSISFIASK